MTRLTFVRGQFLILTKQKTRIFALGGPTCPLRPYQAGWPPIDHEPPPTTLAGVAAVRLLFAETKNRGRGCRPPSCRHRHDRFPMSGITALTARPMAGPRKSRHCFAGKAVQSYDLPISGRHRPSKNRQPARQAPFPWSEDRGTRPRGGAPWNKFVQVHHQNHKHPENGRCAKGLSRIFFANVRGNEAGIGKLRIRFSKCRF